MPEVSVIIPAYNAAHYLAEAVDSVLRQSFQDFEILVIDDGSTDDTEELMRGYRTKVRYLRQQNSGVAIARNHGIEQSRGRYIAFLDADDTWAAHKLERQLTAMADHKDYRICYSAFTITGPDLTPISVSRSRRQAHALEDILLRGNVIATPTTVMGERALFVESGGFDSALSQCADWDMWVRLAALTDFLYIDEPLAWYRRHGANMSRNASLLEQDSFRVLEKGFAMEGVADRLRARRRFAFARNYMVVAGTHFHAGNYRAFARCAARAVIMDFRQASYLMAFPVRLAVRMFSHRASETA
jgi:teichuronic acid biosynthesis glycosyltransferase TuaG